MQASTTTRDSTQTLTAHRPGTAQPSTPRCVSVKETPDWLAQPLWVAETAAVAPSLELVPPRPNALTIGGHRVPVPFAAWDLSSQVASRFTGQFIPSKWPWEARFDKSGQGVNKVVFSHTVCNSVAHTLPVLARNKASYHGIIGVEGELYQLLDLELKAYAAGPFNENVVAFTFQSPVDSRVQAEAWWTGEGQPEIIYEAMPRKGTDLYPHWRINDSQKRTAGAIVSWLGGDQSPFNIQPQVADPAWLPNAAEALQFSGAVGLYQLRAQHIAPGYDAMHGVGEYLLAG